MAYKNQYKGRKMHSIEELQQICESQYETIRKLLDLANSCDSGLQLIRDFDEDTEMVYDDPGHIASIQQKVIAKKLSELD